MVGTVPHDLCQVLGLLIDGHGTDTGTKWGGELTYTCRGPVFASWQNNKLRVEEHVQFTDLLPQNSGILNRHHSCQGRLSGKGQRMTRARRELVLELLAYWGLHLDLCLDRLQGLWTAAVHPLPGLLRGQNIVFMT